MRSVEFIDTNVPGAGALGQIPFDPFLAMVASLKTSDNESLVQSWINPDPAMSIVENGEFKLRDAASEMVLTGPTDGSGNLLSKTTALNGQPTLTASNPCALLGDFSNNPDQLTNPNAYTLVMVHNLTTLAAGDSHDLFGIGQGGVGGGELYPTLQVLVEGFGDNRTLLAAPEGGSTSRRIQAVLNDADIFGTAAVTMCTFSVEHGLSLWLNGSQIATEPTDTAPLTNREWTAFGNRSGATSALGDFGIGLVLRGDLSAPEYAYARDVILSGLMAKYGIAG